jgi:hypothetical protein
MSRKRRNRSLSAVLLAFVVGLGIYAWLHPRPLHDQVARQNQGPQGASATNALERPDPSATAAIQGNSGPVQPGLENPFSPAGAPAGPASPLQFTNFAPATVVENVRRAIRQYGAMFGGNPVGTNPEITAALAGDNPRHINFLDAAAGMRVNENGETVDPWGTPFFFHQLSGTEMEIRSAGPDRTLWTYDDLVIR